MIRLSKNFTLKELTATDVDIPNVPDAGVLNNINTLVTYVLQPIRDRWGRVQVNSGYRNPSVNKKLKGSPTSLHLTGQAADFWVGHDRLIRVWSWLQCSSTLVPMFGEAILYPTHIHITSAAYGQPIKEMLLKTDTGFTTVKKGVLWKDS